MIHLDPHAEWTLPPAQAGSNRALYFYQGDGVVIGDRPLRDKAGVQLRADGSPSSELRLWHALELQLLAPFEYFGCDDDTDLSDVPWDQPGEREVLAQRIALNEGRARTIVREWQRGEATEEKVMMYAAGEQEDAA